MFIAMITEIWPYVCVALVLLLNIVKISDGTNGMRKVNIRMRKVKVVFSKGEQYEIAICLYKLLSSYFERQS